MKEEEEDLGTSLAPLTPKQEPDLDDSGEVFGDAVYYRELLRLGQDR